MEEGFLLDGVDICRTCTPVNQCHIGAVHVFTHAAIAAFPGRDLALTGAYLAFDPVFCKFLVVHRFTNEPVRR